MNLEYWLGGFFPEASAQFITYETAVEKLENEIIKVDPDSETLEWIRIENRGWIEICHHKAFRRFDINISSISAGKWRGVMSLRGTDGLERAATVEKYLIPIEFWIQGLKQSNDSPDREFFNSVYDLLGEKDDTKMFLASLLVSLLRPQQVAAKLRAEKRQTNARATRNALGDLVDE